MSRKWAGERQASSGRFDNMWVPRVSSLERHCFMKASKGQLPDTRPGMDSAGMRGRHQHIAEWRNLKKA